MLNFLILYNGYCTVEQWEVWSFFFMKNLNPTFCPDQNFCLNKNYLDPVRPQIAFAKFDSVIPDRGIVSRPVLEFLNSLNRVGIGLSYIPARQATQPGGIGSLESILGLLKSLKIQALTTALIVLTAVMPGRRRRLSSSSLQRCRRRRMLCLLVI